MNDLTQLLRESFEYSMTNVHTAFPGIVVKYDAETRRADIQPSIKRKLPSGEFAEFPVIPDIPVLFLGTKKYTIHFPLEKDDEVLCVVMERGTDVWRDNGGSGNEETDPRRFDLMDCVAIPGLQPVEFITAEADEGLTVVHKTKTDGDFISSVAMNDDKIELKYKDTVDFFIENKHFTATLDKAKLEVKGNKISFKNNSKDVFTVLSKILDDTATAMKNVYSHKDMGSPFQHTVSPDDQAKMQMDEQNIKQDKSDLGEVMEAG